MSIVKGIVEEHGGSIEVESEPGAGARFGIRFPAIRGRAPSEEVRLEGGVGEEVPGAGRRVLLVDDERTILEALWSYLEQQGFEVECAASGQEAMEACEGGSFDVVLMDLHLPDMPGEELYRRLVTVDAQLICRFVFTSGQELDPHLRELTEGMGERFLPKPFNFDELMGLLGQVLEQELHG